MPNTTTTSFSYRLDCGKTMRHDFNGYCMDCADENGISDPFTEAERKKNLANVKRGPLSAEQKRANLRTMSTRLLQHLEIRADISSILASTKPHHSTK
jgi:hypothetical protein